MNWQSRMAVFGLGLVLLGTLVSCGGDAKPSPAAVETAKPNVILISVDTLRADHLSAYGYTRNQTPDFDGLAAQGVLFEQAVTPVPLTLPAHTSLLTGTLPIFHGIRDNSGFVLGDKPATLAGVLSAAGYRTGAFVGSFILDSRFGLNRGFDYYYDDFQSDTLGTVNFQISERRAAEVLGRALPWIRGTVGQPFFVWIHLFDPHAPYAAPASFRTSGRLPYDAEVSYVDSELGRFFDGLKSDGLFDGSLIVLTADHGEGLGDHGESTHGMFLYDSTLHVPLIFKLPGNRKAGTRVPDQVRLIDVKPTILSVLSIPAPEDVQGVSLTPAWEGRGIPALPAYSETQLPRLNYGWAALESYRFGGHKLIEAPKPELYDLQADPREQHNLFAGDEKLVRQLEQEKQKLVARFSSSGAELAERGAGTDTETAQRLRSLGYAGGGSPGNSNRENSNLPDPKDKIDLFNRIWEAQEASQAARYTQSIQLLQSVLTRDPSIFIAHSIQALNYLQLGRPADSLLHLEATVRLRPDDPGSHFYLATARLRLNQLGPAAREFETALRLDPRNEAAINNLAAVYVRQKQYGKAEAIFRKIVNRSPDDEAARVNLGVTLMFQEKYPEALESFQKALALNPNLAEVQNNAGLLYMRMSRLDEAIPYLQRAVELNPRYANAHLNLAEVYRRKGMDAEAEREMAAARRLSGR